MKITGRERVLAAIDGSKPDRVPKGELVIDQGLIRGFLGRGSNSVSFADQVDFLRLMGMDLISLHPLVSGRSNLSAVDSLHIPDLDRWIRETDLFTFVVLDGGFGWGIKLLGFEEFLMLSISNPGEFKEFLARVAGFNRELARRFRKAGVDGMVIADDVGYQGGLFLPLETLQSCFSPFWREQVREIQSLGVPAFFHSDGDISTLLPDLVAAGFDGVQGLQPAAGMAIRQVKRDYGDRLCLWGNLDLDYLLPLGSPEEIKAHVRGLMQDLAPGGGYIFGSSGGLAEGLPHENIMAAYQAAKEFG